MTVSRTVAFVVHPERPEAAELAANACEWLKEQGHDTKFVDEGPIATADLAVSLGGDGTMLRTVAMAAPNGIPVLGVNLGRLGYLTEVEPAGFQKALQRFLSGDFTIEERISLQVTLQRESQGTNTPLVDFLVFNEAVVEKTVPGHTIRVSASICGTPFVTYAADGLLVATPTGSTAYNLSVRGPILSPSMKAIVVTPISPHMLFDRTLVLDAGEWLTLRLEAPREAVLVMDGTNTVSIEPGDSVECRIGQPLARLVSFGGRSFFGILRARFNLADR